MQKSPTLFAFILLATTLNAQTPTGKALGGQAGEQFHQVVALPGGAYLLAGSTASEDGDVKGKTSGQGDIWLAKTTLEGIEWERRYGGAGHEWAKSVTVSDQGGYFLVGTIDSLEGDIKAVQGKQDIWLCRLSENGDILWQQTFGGREKDEAVGVLALPEGACLVVGQTSSSDGDIVDLKGSTDIWLAQVSKAGQIEWSQTLGGQALDLVFSVKPTPDGGYFVVGSTTSNDDKILLNRGGADALLIRLDAKGKLLWSETYGGSGDDEFSDLLPAKDGGYYLCGHTESTDGDIVLNHGLLDAWVVKINAFGKLEWSQTYGGLQQDMAIQLWQASDSSLLVVGNAYELDMEVTGVKGQQFDILALTISATDGALKKGRLYGGSGNDFVRSALYGAGFSDLILTGLTDSNDGDITGAKGKKDGLFMQVDAHDLARETPQPPYVRSYPNPAMNMVYFDRPVTGWLLSDTGIPIQQFNNADKASVSELPAGVYFIRITETGQVFRIVKMEGVSNGIRE